MDIVWYGQSCFRIKGKSASVVIDPYNPEMIGLKLPKDLSADIVLVTHEHQDHNFTQVVSGNPLLISGPGEYEKSGVSIVGVASYHDDKKGAERGSNTIYNILIDDVAVIHLGDLGHVLTEEQVSEIGNTDILLVPVGGNYTIDGEKAAKVVSQLEPKIVIPMHYKLEGMSLELSDQQEFLKEMGAENAEPVQKLSISKDRLPEETAVVVLAKNS